MKKAIIILPTYNEKGNIDRIIPVLEDDVFVKIKNWDMGILVVDDESPDGTANIVKELHKKYKNLHLLNGAKKGLGAAYIRGMDYAIKELKAEVIFEMDADFFHDPKKIPQFLEKIDEGYDFVIGTRYSQGGSIPANWALKRKVYSIIGNFIVRGIFMRFSIHDWTGGYRAIKKEVFLKEKDKLSIFKGYRFQVGFLHLAIQDGYKIAEVPFHATDRTAGASKMEGAETIIDTLSYVILARMKELLFGKFGKFLVVGLTGLFINLSIYSYFVHYTTINLVIANTIGAELAIFSNYNLNNLWTFKKKRAKSPIAYLGKMLLFFLTSNIGVQIFQNGTIAIGQHFFGRQYALLYFVIGTGMLLIYNFTVYSRFIWKDTV